MMNCRSGVRLSLGNVALNGPSLPAPHERQVWNCGGMITGAVKLKCLERNLSLYLTENSYSRTPRKL
jgi:hypothetical protein